MTPAGGDKPAGYPVPQTTGPKRDEISTYFHMLFDHVDFEDGHFIILRGIPEKGTPMEGERPVDVPIQITGNVDLVEETVTLAQQWASHHYATYIIPAVMNDAKGTADHVALMTCVCVDIDKGDIAESLAHAKKYLGEPTMLVYSGGHVGKLPKVHLYYALKEPSADILAVVKMRDLLARKLGGDRAFGIATNGNSPVGRAHQPIRIPGTVHSKGMKAGQPSDKRAMIASYNAELTYELYDLCELIEQMPASEGVPPEETAPPSPQAPHVDSSGALQFSPDYRDTPPKGPDPLVTEIHEGGDEDRNRWTEFSRTAGEWIAQARTGRMDRAQAFNLTISWMNAMMKPPWPMERAQREFNALWERDQMTHAPQWAALQQKSAAPPLPPIAEFRLDRIAVGTPPSRRWIVEGVLPRGVVGVLFGAGGLGKSFLALDLAIGVATRHRYGMFAPPSPLGTIPQDAAGSSVFITLEDDTNELHRRTIGLDGGGSRVDAPCYVIPVLDHPGIDPVIVRQQGRNVTLTDFATRHLDAILADARADSGRPVSLLILDPAGDLIEGDENAADAIKPLMRRLREIATRHRCTILLLGHMAKGETNSENVGVKGMRGSGAWTANARVAIGMWSPSESEGRKMLKALELPETPDSLSRLVGWSVTKANHPGAPSGACWLLRDPSTGAFESVTERLRGDARSTAAAALEVLVAAIREAAELGHPFQATGKAGLYERRAQLRPPLRDMGQKALAKLANQACNAGLAEKCRVPGAGTAPCWLDVPNGPYATGRHTSIGTGSLEDARRAAAAPTASSTTRGRQRSADRGTRRVDT